jgi:Bacterial DNA polymerase III alpha NTPase domain
MKIDRFGVCSFSEQDLCQALYMNPDLDLTRFVLDDPGHYNQAILDLFSDLAPLSAYQPSNAIDIEQFDQSLQMQWYMPAEYQNMDIVSWVLDQCKQDAELQRCGQELLLYQERDLMDLLRYLKYLVDTLRKNNIVWGVGRGSSVSSFVLYLIGVHRINSLFYDLDPHEFLK